MTWILFQQQRNDKKKAHNLKCKNETYPADCRKIAAADSNKHDWDWTNRIYWKKKIFVQKYFLIPIYFDGISYLNILLFLRERLQGLLSTPISIRCGN